MFQRTCSVKARSDNNLPAPIRPRGCPLGAWSSNLSPEKGGYGKRRGGIWWMLWQAGSGHGAGRGLTIFS